MKPYLLYEQATGLLCGVDELGQWYPLGEGYSGKPPFVNNADAQHRKGLGPIPRGVYRVGEPYTHGTRGPLVMRLTPKQGNQMFGRSHFLIHGDNRHGNRSASRGCIVLRRDLREVVASHVPIDLHVVRGVDIAEDAAALFEQGMGGDCQGVEPLGAKQSSVQVRKR